MSDELAKPVEAVDSRQALDQTSGEVSKDQKDQQKAVNEYSRTESNGQISMFVKVHSPFREYYVGQAFSLSAENATGPFDVLPRHHNFISLLTACEIVVRSTDKGEQKIRISGGIMHVKSDRTVIFLDV
jgi:hypothetical protein